MNYYYDILINMNDTQAFSFYDWMDNDPIEHVRKIPVIRTSSKVIKDVLIYYVKFSRSILDAIYLKCELFDSKLTKSVDYMFLLTDTKSAVVVECNEDGNVLCISKLMVNEEISLLEISNAFKEQKIEYDKLNKRPIMKGLRIENELRYYLLFEIKTLKKSKNMDKLRYIYYEWTNKLEKDETNIYDKLKDLINGEFSNKHNEIYKLIKLSYQTKNVNS